MGTMIIFPNDIPIDKLPNIGIIIANFNYGNYVEQAIESALKQNYPKIAIMVVDDLSTDNSCDVIEGVYKKAGVTPDVTPGELFDLLYADVGGRDLVFIRMNKHVNVSAARNIAIDLSKDKVDYYLILDADDIAHPEKCSELGAALFSSTNIGVAYADYNNLNVETDISIPELKEPFSRKRLEQECIVHSGAMITKKALMDTKDQFGYYDCDMRTCEDYDLWIRISEKFMIVHVPKILTTVRVHKRNSTHTVPRQEWEYNWHRIAEKLKFRNGKV